MKKILSLLFLLASLMTIAACKSEDPSEPTEPIPSDPTIVEKTLQDYILEAKIELEGYLNTSTYSEAYQVYAASVVDDWKDVLDEQLSTESLNTMLLQAKEKLDELKIAMDGGAAPSWICETKNPLEQCQPVILGLPTDFELVVSRGFSGNIMSYFNITAQDYKGDNITSLMRIHGEPIFGISNTYEIVFEAQDEQGNITLSNPYQLVVEPVIGTPVMVIAEPEKVINVRNVSSFNFMDGVNVTDVLGWDISSRVEITVLNGQDVEVEYLGLPGYYKIVFEVTDVDGNFITKFREVTIMPSSATMDTGLNEVMHVTPTLMFFNAVSVHNWVPHANDPYVNTGVIPLQPRVMGQSMNPNANKDVKVAILDQITEIDSGVPLFQGFHQYTIEYFQYMDLAVTWSGAGNIVSPTQDVINVFHKNGVKILGNIFMKPVVYGGDIAETRALVRKDEQGNYIVGKILIDIAEYYGFDGWFINLETAGGNAEIATDFHLMGLYMQDLIRTRGLDMEIQWYDSMITSGSITWQGTLNNNNMMFFQHEDQVVHNSMFLDFRWDGRYGAGRQMSQAAQAAIAVGRSPYDLYAGFDTQQYGIARSSGTQTPWQWNRYFDANNQPLVSIGFYMSSWTFFQDNQPPNPRTYERFTINAQNMWVGPEGDPRLSQVDLVNRPNAWYGISSFVNEKTAIVGDHFHTNFSTGNGHQYYLDGEVVTSYTQGWNNLSIQDLLPTWRWIRDSHGSGAPLNINFNYQDAYQKGSNLNIHGVLNQDNATEFQVYMTYLDIHEDTHFDLTYKTNDLGVTNKVRITFENENGWYDEVHYLTLTPEITNTWVRDTFALGAHAGKKMTSIGYLVESDVEVNYDLRLGEMSVYRGIHIVTEQTEILGLTLVEAGFQYGIYADARITWTPLDLTVAGFILYEIFYENEEGTLKYLTSTYAHHAYIKNLERLVNGQHIDASTVVVRAVDGLGQTLAVSEMIFTWTDPIVGGRARFSVSTSLIRAGQSVTFTPMKSPVAETLTWEFPGVSENHIVYNQNGTVTVTYPYQGVYGVKLTSTNQFGSDILELDHVIVVSEAASRVTNITGNARVSDFSGFVVPAEHPRYLIDGNFFSTKWCETTASSPGNKFVTIDFTDVYYMSHFRVYHAGAVEQKSYNTVEFQIQVSLDNINWTTVVHVTNNTLDRTEHPVTPVEARYVKIVVINGGSDNAARIYELVVFGRIA